MTSIEHILDYARAVGDAFRPEKIILFGSYGYGEPTEDSDVDLLVVMDHSEKNPRQAARIRDHIRAPFALDLLVRTPAQIRERISLGDPFVKDITRYGNVIYESPRTRMD